MKFLYSRMYLFYTGLGLADIIFIKNFIKYNEILKIEDSLA